MLFPWGIPKDVFSGGLDCLYYRGERQYHFITNGEKCYEWKKNTLA